MLAHVNFKSGVPVYLQIVQQVKDAAASGSLRPGEALPSVRALAEELRYVMAKMNHNQTSMVGGHIMKKRPAGLL